MSMLHRSSSVGTLLTFAWLACASAASANSPPEYLGGSIVPDSHLILGFQDIQPASDGRMGQAFIVETEWSDPDGDFVVDVTVRYRNRHSDFWLEVVLDYVSGTSPPQFSKVVLIDGIPGEYEYAFRASDAEIADGPRIHITDWVFGGTIDILSLSDPSCIGNVFEQSVDETTGGTPPILSVDAPLSAQEGSRITLTADYEVAAGGTPFFRWCVNKGYFEYDPAFPDYSQVHLVTPLVPAGDEEIHFSVTIGDNLGNSVISEGGLLVEDTGIFVPEDPAPAIEFETPDQVKANSANWIRFFVEDFSAEGGDESEFLVSRLFYSRENGPFEMIRDGIRGSIVFQSWIPPFSSSDVRLKLEVTDGNSLVDFITPSFSIVPTYRIFGTVLDEAGEPVFNELIEFHFGEHTSFHTRSTSPFGFYEREVTAGSFTVILPDAGMLPAPITVELSETDPFKEVNFILDEGGGSEEVQIDIKPGSDINPINPGSQGKIPVAILSSATFNAPAEVDRYSLTFGHTGDENSLHRRGSGDVPNCGEGDVNGDGIADLICHFHTPVAAFQAGDTEGILRGQTVNGELFEGRDTITIVPHGYDSDNDGAADEFEDDGPNRGDGNGDGILDSLQPNVSSLPSSLTKNFITLVTSLGCNPSQVTAVDPGPLLDDPEGLEAPEGLIAFVLESCDLSDIEVYWHGQSNPNGFEYRRHGPTSSLHGNHWYTLPGATIDSVVIDGASVLRTSYQLQDGGLGDDDLMQNGRIVDPGGPARLPLSAIPTLSEVGLISLILLLLGAGLFMIARHRCQATPSLTR